MVDSIEGGVNDSKYDSSLVVDTTKPAPKPFTSHSQNWPNFMAFAKGALAGFLLRGPRVIAFKLLDNPDLDPRVTLKRALIGVLRESFHGATLFGPYEILRRKVEYTNKGPQLSPYQGFGCAVVSGAVGAYLYTPIVLANSRLKAPNATHSRLLHDLYHRAANEGILSLWKSKCLFTKKMCAYNVGILASYEPSLNFLKDSVGLAITPSVLGAGFVSGLFASASSYPYVYIYDALKHMKPGTNGKYPYTGYVDCALKVMKFGGPFAIYRGSTMYFVRTTPAITLLWLFYEEVKKIGLSS